MSKEHTFVSPGPAGLGAVACFGFGAVFSGKVGPGGMPLLAAIVNNNIYGRVVLPTFGALIK